MTTTLRLATCANRPVTAPIDLHSALGACQALSREIVHGEVCKTLMALALSHSGADSGMLLLVHERTRVIAARAWAFAGHVDVCLDSHAPTPQQAPLALFAALDILRASVVPADGTLPCGAADPYIHGRAPRSALGVPLLHNDEVVGMLYLEHSHEHALFTAARVDLLELMAIQAAMSLAHVQLVAQMRVDSAQRRRTEDALRQAQAELARAARVTTMGQFAASIAHEVSQPLAAVALHAGAALNWLQQQPPQRARARQALEMVLYSAGRAGNMVRGIRAMARKTGPELALFDVDEAVRETLSLMRAELQGLGILVDTDLGLDGRQLRADRAQLQQVIMNLVLNAIDALAAVDTRQRRLALRSRHAAGALQICVTDNGSGIAPGAAARLFEALFSTKPGGMGMGLSISRAIVEAHGGQLWCDASAAHGCTFHLSLPAAHL
jgi:signal transduction histidine kinase